MSSIKANVAIEDDQTFSTCHVKRVSALKYACMYACITTVHTCTYMYSMYVHTYLSPVDSCPVIDSCTVVLWWQHDKSISTNILIHNTVEPLNYIDTLRRIILSIVERLSCFRGICHYI